MCCIPVNYDKEVSEQVYAILTNRMKSSRVYLLATRKFYFV